MHTQAQSLLEQLYIEDTGVPIYVQLREQLLQMVGAGMLKAGDQMPTMRQVAVALRVDLNTVRHAYDDLERRGAILLVRGRGSFVADNPPPKTDARAAARKAESLASQALAQALAAGVDPNDLAERLIALSKGGKS